MEQPVFYFQWKAKMGADTPLETFDLCDGNWSTIRAALESKFFASSRPRGAPPSQQNDGSRQKDYEAMRCQGSAQVDHKHLLADGDRIKAKEMLVLIRAPRSDGIVRRGGVCN